MYHNKRLHPPRTHAHARVRTDMRTPVTLCRAWKTGGKNEVSFNQTSRPNACHELFDSGHQAV